MTTPAFTLDDVALSEDDILFRETGEGRDRVLSTVGICNWQRFFVAGLSLDTVYEAAKGWKAQLDGVEKPWLVWSINEDWCLVQQKLVRLAGWTPVVGYDPRGGAPTKLIDEAILIDFNCFNLPVLYMHFPMEFAFLFAPRLAFWHADLLCTPEQMTHLAGIFESLEEGRMAITKPNWSWHYTLRNYNKRRFWELAGCVTHGASKDLFDTGCGFWYDWMYHPNCPDRKEFLRRRKRYWDHGAGLKYWHDRYKKDTYLIDEAYLDPGHFSRLSKKDFVVVTPQSHERNAAVDLMHNYTLEEAAASIGLDLSAL